MSDNAGRVLLGFLPLAMILFGCPTSLIITQDWKVGFVMVVVATIMLTIGVLGGKVRLFG
jgi:hypothetical protein